MSGRRGLGCEAVDELAAAFALGAMESAEERAVSAHLATCDKPHAEAHALLDAALVVPATLDPVVPSDALRSRLMATVAVTPQEHVRVAPPVREAYASEPRRRWWQLSPVPSALAAAGLAAAVGLGAWGVNLNEQLRQRDAALAAIASADAVHPIAGEAGSGLVLDTGETATFVVENIADLPADRLYQFWLIDAEGNALPAGTLRETDGVALVDLGRSLEGATTFAVTLERTPVEAPTSAPILAGELDT